MSNKNETLRLSFMPRLSSLKLRLPKWEDKTTMTHSEKKFCRHLDTEWSGCLNTLTQACQNTNYPPVLHCDVLMSHSKRKRGHCAGQHVLRLSVGQLVHCSNVAMIWVESTFFPVCSVLFMSLSYVMKQLHGKTRSQTSSDWATLYIWTHGHT